MEMQEKISQADLEVILLLAHKSIICIGEIEALVCIYLVHWHLPIIVTNKQTHALTGE